MLNDRLILIFWFDIHHLFIYFNILIPFVFLGGENQTGLEQHEG